MQINMSTYMSIWAEFTAENAHFLRLKTQY